MKVTTTSQQPQTRSAKTPYTSVTIKVSAARGNSPSEVLQRGEQLTFLSLLVRALNPKIGLTRVNTALRDVVSEAKDEE